MSPLLSSIFAAHCCRHGRREWAATRYGEERQIAGSIITSRKVYDESEGRRAEDGFRRPVVVVTRRPQDAVVRGETTITFVTEGITSPRIP